MISGQTDGIRKSKLAELEELYELTVPKDKLLTAELAERLLALSLFIKREVAVYISRQGTIEQVMVGDSGTVALGATGQRHSGRKLSGWRCVHTHPQASCLLSDLDIAALNSLRLDAMVAITEIDGRIYGEMAVLTGETEAGENMAAERGGSVALAQLLSAPFDELLRDIEKRLAANYQLMVADGGETAIIVGLELDSGKTLWPIEESLEELRQLADTAGAKVVGKLVQRKARPDAACFLGSGKLTELAQLVQTSGANTVIFDDELSGSQLRNIEQRLQVKVVDRTALILDIFAQRARSYEGKLQVELAQLNYLLPRISGQNTGLSRLGGGIGTRGPGETKLEVDKRRIRSRISDIKQQIEAVKQQRQLHRRQRAASNIPTVALVGYTNAGKSTLLNTLTSSDDVLAEDKLFATLDPTTRCIKMADGRELLVTDTVGFIQKLPHQLVTAFRATLEEVQQADVLLHVVDSSHENYEQQMLAVMSVLKELAAGDKPMITVFNKIDKLNNEFVLRKLTAEPDSVAIAAKSGQGVARLLEAMAELAAPPSRRLKLLVPYDEAATVAELYDKAVVKAVDYAEGGTALEVVLEERYMAKYSRYIVEEED